MSDKTHAVQAKILYTLRHVTRARYSELMRPTGLDGDRFKYHLQSLVRKKYVQKDSDGMYELTSEGKGFANRLNEETGYTVEGPKASMLLLVRSRANNQIHYLAHQRLREPFFGFWGIASTPVVRGTLLCEAAARELNKQTGIGAMFRVVGVERVIDTTPTGSILEDKLFSLLVADVEDCPAPHDWHGGKSVWLTREELLMKTRLFPTTALTLQMIERGETFVETKCVYMKNEY